MEVVRKGNYVGIVLHKDGEHLFITSPALSKVFKRAGANAQAYANYLEFSSTYNLKRGYGRVNCFDVEFLEVDDALAFVKAASTGLIKDIEDKGMSNNPIDNYIMNEYFGKEKNIKDLVKLRQEQESFSRMIKGVTSKLKELDYKVTSVKDALELSAINKNVNEIERLQSMLDGILRSLSNKIGDELVHLDSKLIKKEEKFNPEKFLNL